MSGLKITMSIIGLAAAAVTGEYVARFNYESGKRLTCAINDSDDSSKYTISAEAVNRSHFSTVVLTVKGRSGSFSGQIDEPDMVFFRDTTEATNKDIIFHDPAVAVIAAFVQGKSVRQQIRAHELESVLKGCEETRDEIKPSERTKFMKFERTTSADGVKLVFN